MDALWFPYYQTSSLKFKEVFSMKLLPYTKFVTTKIFSKLYQHFLDKQI